MFDSVCTYRYVLAACQLNVKSRAVIYVYTSKFKRFKELISPKNIYNSSLKMSCKVPHLGDGLAIAVGVLRALRERCCPSSSRTPLVVTFYDTHGRRWGGVILSVHTDKNNPLVKYDDYRDKILLINLT